MKYRAYRTKSNNAYRFQFMSEGGDAILSGGPFQEKEACFDAIRAVIAASGTPTNYSLEKTSDGQSYFVISSNGNEIARSVSYGSEAEASSSMSLTQKEGPAATAKEKSGSSGKSEAAKPASTSTSSDDYKPLAFYESKITGVKDGFDKFDDGGEYYFTYNLDGVVLMISEGYSSENGRDNGVNSVTKNMPEESRYQYKQHDNGKYYFNLRAGNHQEIATSRWFNSEGDAQSAAGFARAGTAGGNLKSMFGGSKEKGSIYKDYKPLNFYVERIEGSAFGYDSFAESDDHYFTVNYDGSPVLISETYKSEKGRDNGINSVKRNSKKKERYVKEQHSNGKYLFRLFAGNKQEIATSRWFDDAKERDRMISWLTSTGGTRKRKKAVREKSAGERVYVRQGQPYPCSDITFDTFKSGGNGKYYFVFKDAEGKVLLINGDVRGYVDTAGVDAAIDQVIKFGPDKKNYESRISKTGKHYFFIKNDEGKSVARGSLFYAEESVMNNSIDMLACGAGVSAAAPKAAAAAAPASTKVVDDYLPCEAYGGESHFRTFFNEARKEYYFAYNNTDGKTFLRSEGYTSAAGRDNGIESVKKNAPIDERWSTNTALNGKYHYYALKAGNNQEIARSCYYDSQAALQADYDWVRGGDSNIGKGAAMFAGAWMTGNAIASRKAEDESKAAEEAKRAAEAKARAEEEARLAAEAKAKARAEEEARQAAAAKAKAEEEARLAAVAKAKAAEDARLAAAAAAAAKSKALEAEKAKSAYPVDDYLPCERYKGDAGFHKFTDAESGEHYFAYNRKSGETYLRSEGYKTVAARDNGIESVKKNSPIEKRWGTGTALNDRYHYYHLKAANHQEIARSCYYKDKAAMMAAFGWIQGGDSGIGKVAAGAAGAAALAATALAATPKKTPPPPPPPPPKKVVERVAAVETPRVVEKERGGMGWLLWLLGALALIALIWFLAKSCCAVPPVVTDDDTAIIDDPVPPTPPAPLGPNGAGMGLTPGTLASNMADFFSDPASRCPNTWTADKCGFSKNSIRLNTAARNQLDNVITVLKEYPNCRLGIRGYISGEKGTYRGSKEISLDGMRAKAVKDYLMKGGIEDSRLNVSDGGEADSRNIEFTCQGC